MRPPKLESSSPGRQRAASCLGAALLAAAVACDSGPPGTASTDSEALALTAAEAVSRAGEWADAKLQYCQAPNHQRDYDDACSTYCNRTDNPAWDPYRSDCSGLVSWSWILPAPGRVTWQFAPFMNDISHAIPAASLQPGDAVNNSHHIMLFTGWTVPGSRGTFIEEPGCSTSITYAHRFTSDVSVSGNAIYVGYNRMNFTAIRFAGSGDGGSGGGGCVPGGLYCGGDKVSGDSSTLYRCNGDGAPTVVERCSNGCAVRPGQDDMCGGGGSGSSCVTGGLYCGGDKVAGDPSTLYQCNGSSAPAVVQYCASGCVVRPGQDDACGSGSSSCVAGGLYCGGDKVSGDPDTLYRCNGTSAPTVAQRCAAGCVVRPGQDDACGSGSSSCVAGGLYCGGDKVSGDSSTLYRCNGTAAPSEVQRCAGGCVVHPGKDDACASGGSSCVAGGLYCGGDKVSGDPNTLYRCNASAAPSVVEYCSGGCIVRPGQNDLCGARSCQAGGLYCGGDKLPGNPDTLYRCNSGGAPSVVQACSTACVVRPGQDDVCGSGGGCVTGGLYCGGDKVTGNPNTLYQCNGAGAPSIVEYCSTGCLVRAGQNDTCR